MCARVRAQNATAPGSVNALQTSVCAIPQYREKLDEYQCAGVGGWEVGVGCLLAGVLIRQ